VLITTRDSQLGKKLSNVKKKPIDVLPFGLKEADILLRSKLPEDDEISQEDANEITKALNYLPLAITQAAAYLDQNNVTIAKYLQLFRAGKADTSDLLKKGIHDPGRDYKIQNSVMQTWKISFNQISKQDPRAAEVLSLMAVLDRQAISENFATKKSRARVGVHRCGPEAESLPTDCQGNGSIVSCNFRPKSGWKLKTRLKDVKRKH
jgi:hypothetical protein